jgi:hypothetical protein
MDLDSRLRGNDKSEAEGIFVLWIYLDFLIYIDMVALLSLLSSGYYIMMPVLVGYDN